MSHCRHSREPGDTDYNSVGVGKRVVVHKIKNAYERPVERRVNFAALLARM